MGLGPSCLGHGDAAAPPPVSLVVGEPGDDDDTGFLRRLRLVPDPPSVTAAERDRFRRLHRAPPPRAGQAEPEDGPGAWRYAVEYRLRAECPLADDDDATPRCVTLFVVHDTAATAAAAATETPCLVAVGLETADQLRRALGALDVDRADDDDEQGAVLRVLELAERGGERTGLRAVRPRIVTASVDTGAPPPPPPPAGRDGFHLTSVEADVLWWADEEARWTAAAQAPIHSRRVRRGGDGRVERFASRMVAAYRVPVRGGDWATLLLLGMGGRTLPVFVAPRAGLRPGADLLGPLLGPTTDPRAVHRVLADGEGVARRVRPFLGCESLRRLGATCRSLAHPGAGGGGGAPAGRTLRWTLGADPAPPPPERADDEACSEVCTMVVTVIALPGPPPERPWLGAWLRAERFPHLRELRVVLVPPTRRQGPRETPCTVPEGLMRAIWAMASWRSLESLHVDGRFGGSTQRDHLEDDDDWLGLTEALAARRQGPLGGADGSACDPRVHFGTTLCVSDLRARSLRSLSIESMAPVWVRTLAPGFPERESTLRRMLLRYVDVVRLPAVSVLQSMHVLWTLMSHTESAEGCDALVRLVPPLANDTLVLTRDAWRTLTDDPEGLWDRVWDLLLGRLASDPPGRSPHRRHRTLVLEWPTTGPWRRDPETGHPGPRSYLEMPRQDGRRAHELRLELVFTGGTDPRVQPCVARAVGYHRGGGTVLRFVAHPDPGRPHRGFLEGMLRHVLVAQAGRREPLCVHVRLDAAWCRGYDREVPLRRDAAAGWLAEVLWDCGLPWVPRGEAPWCLVVDGASSADEPAAAGAWGPGCGGLGHPLWDDSEWWLQRLSGDLAAREPATIEATTDHDDDAPTTWLRGAVARQWRLQAAACERKAWFRTRLTGRVFVLPSAVRDPRAAHDHVNEAMRRIGMQPSSHGWVPTPDPTMPT